MPTSKEAELNVAVLHYIAKCLAEGDDGALTHLGLGRHDAEAAQSLAFGDLYLLSSVHFPVLRDGAVDRNLFHRLMNHVRRTRASKSLLDALLTLDAPLALMHHFFGMDSNAYAERGRSLQLVRPIGRPPEPTEAEEQAIWQAYADLEKPEGEEPSAEDYLALHRATGIPLRTLWLIVQRAGYTNQTKSPARAVR